MVILAAVLILVGGVFQFGELGFGHSALQNIWLVTVVAPGVWNAVASRLNAPDWQELMRYWPLGLVGTGLSIMLISHYRNRRGGDGQCAQGESHGA
jgi:hypothetical protein